MTIVTIPNIRDLGTVPNNNMEESVYNATAEAFTGQMSGWGEDNKAVGEAGRTNALHAQGAADSANSSAGTANQRANDASASANTANTKAGEATTAATNAAASYAAIQKLYLGPKVVAPTVDNQGAALQLGAWYTNTTNGYWYWWNGANWIVGVGDLNSVDWATQVTNKPALVNSVMGRSGAVTGLIEQSVTLADSVDLNTVITTGFYRLGNTPVNGPTEASIRFGQLIVSRGGDTILQIATGYGDGIMVFRHGGGIGTGSPSWQPWQRLLGSLSIMDSVKTVDANTGTTALAPAQGSKQIVTLYANTTINVATPRNGGDAITIRVMPTGSFSFSFGAGIQLPTGASLPTLSAWQMATFPLIAKHDASGWDLFVGGKHG